MFASLIHTSVLLFLAFRLHYSYKARHHVINFFVPFFFLNIFPSLLIHLFSHHKLTHQKEGKVFVYPQQRAKRHHDIAKGKKLNFSLTAQRRCLFGGRRGRIMKIFAFDIRQHCSHAVRHFYLSNYS